MQILTEKVVTTDMTLFLTEAMYYIDSIYKLKRQPDIHVLQFSLYIIWYTRLCSTYITRPGQWHLVILNMSLAPPVRMHVDKLSYITCGHKV